MLENTELYLEPSTIYLYTFIFSFDPYLLSLFVHFNAVVVDNDDDDNNNENDNEPGGAPSFLQVPPTGRHRPSPQPLTRRIQPTGQSVVVSRRRCRRRRCRAGHSRAGNLVAVINPSFF